MGAALWIAAEYPAADAGRRCLPAVEYWAFRISVRYGTLSLLILGGRQGDRQIKPLPSMRRDGAAY